MNISMAVAIGAGKPPPSSIFQQPIATTAEESASGENYTMGLRQYLNSQKKNRSSLSKGRGTIAPVPK